jgi:phosphatidylglycerol:prolipoprotein diacylglycerol transferase
MLPELLRIGPFTIFAREFGPLIIRTYGLLLAIGFALGMALAANRGKKRGVDPDLILDLGFYAILSGIIGGRLFFVIQYPDYYFSHPVRILKILEGGLVFYGGLIVAFLVSAFYLRMRRAPLLAVGDIMAPSIALGQAIGRLGCFAAGCCYGKPTSLFWGVTFTDPACLADPKNVPLHPTQLYLSVADLAIMGTLIQIDRRRKFAGQTFVSYFILYAVVRFLIEFLRGDDRGSFFGLPLSPAQGIGLVVLALALVAYLFLKKRSLPQPE